MLGISLRSYIQRGRGEGGSALELLNAVNLQLQITAVITLSSSAGPPLETCLSLCTPLGKLCFFSLFFFFALLLMVRLSTQGINLALLRGLVKGSACERVYCPARSLISGFIPTQGQDFTLLLAPLQRATELAALCDMRWKRVHCPTHPLGSWRVF